MRFPFPAPTGASSVPPSVLVELQPGREIEQQVIPTANAYPATAAGITALPVLMQNSIPAEMLESSALEIEIPAQLITPASEQGEQLPENAKSPSEGPSIRVPDVPRPRTRRKVIAFPRHLMATPDAAYRLADPVTPEQPRILDVPEELEALSATPFLDGLTFDGKIPRQPGAPEYVELPSRPVTVAQRAYAVLIDATLVAVATAIFAAVAYKLAPGLVMDKPLLLAAAAIPVLLWFVYQYLLVVYGGTTPGMRVSKIRLLTFAGTTPKLSQRRNRIIGLCLSTASLAMGLFWAFVDVDALCWHDRISQTYLTDL